MFSATVMLRKERVVLKHHADAALLDRHVGDVLAVHEYAALGGPLEAGEHGECGRLARPRGAQQRQKLAAGDLEVESADGVDRAVIAFANVDKPNERLWNRREHAPVQRIPCQPARCRVGELLHLGARRLDDRRELLFLGGAEGGGVGRRHPDLGGALLVEGGLHAGLSAAPAWSAPKASRPLPAARRPARRRRPTR